MDSFETELWDLTHRRFNLTREVHGRLDTGRPLDEARQELESVVARMDEMTEEIRQTARVLDRLEADPPAPADFISLATARLNLTAEAQGRIKTDRPMGEVRRELREVDAKLARFMPPKPSEASTPAT